MAHRGVYTRRNLDHNPPQILSSPEMLFRRRRRFPKKLGVVHLWRPCLVPKKVDYNDNIQFDIKFEQTLFRSKYESNVSDTIFDETRFKTFIPSSASQEVNLLPQDQEIWFQFQKLEKIVHESQIAISKSSTFPFSIPSFSASFVPLVSVEFHIPISSAATTTTSFSL